MRRPARGRISGLRWLSAPAAALTAFAAAIAVGGGAAALPVAAGVPLAPAMPVAAAAPAAAAPAAAAPAPGGGLAGYVNPFIGTQPAPSSHYGFGFDTGDVFPGAVAPHGMLAWSPDTTSGQAGGYWYPDNTIKGFSLDHFSGRGCSYQGDIPLMPVPAPVTTSPATNPAAYRSTFSHAGESASPGRYQVRLDSGVKVALGATTRTGIGQFSYPAGAPASSMIINTSGSVNGDSGATVSIDPATATVTGSATTHVGCGSDPYTVYFTAHFDHPFTGYGTWSGGTLTPGSTAASGPGSGAWLSFSTASGAPVTAKTALSWVSTANAEQNLHAEDPGWNATAVAASTAAAWDQALSVIRATGGDAGQLTLFYTELYHFLIEPGTFNDVNGQYIGFDDKIHTVAPGRVQYDNITTWDGYRSFIALLALLEPGEASDVITSMLNDAAQGGPGLPRWEQANRNSGGMDGDDPDPYVATAYAYGARGFDTAAALHAMDLGASVPGTTSGGHLVRDNDQQWLSGHYDPGQAAISLEYASDDFAIAAFARSLGNTALYNTYMPRAQNWEYTFNPATGFAEPKDASGAFPPNFDPASESGFVEGDAYQYTPLVPFNVAGLAAAAGGPAAYTRYLDQLYANPNSGPNGTGAFAGNEPSEEIPWQFDYTGAPWKTQAATRNVITNFYTPTPGGLPGNDDGGALSSWYLWAAIGMYPETPGIGTLALGSPLFPHTEITLGSGKVLTLNAPGATPGTAYVHNLTVNGARWTHAYLPLSAISNGGTLGYSLGTSPDTGWASGPADAPPSFASGEAPAVGYTQPSAQLAVQPGATTSVTLAARNVTGSPQAVTWNAAPAAGVNVAPGSGAFQIPAAGDGSQRVQVTAGTAEGRYPVTFHLTAAGGTALPDVVLNVVVAKPGSLVPYDNNTGISADSNQAAANYDGDGYSYSEQALTAAGLAPGATVSSGGVSYSWPDQPAGQPDNVTAAGQTVSLQPQAGAATLGLLGSATNAGTAGSSGTLTVTYTDGSSQQVPVALSDWTLGGGAGQPVAGNAVVAKLPYRNSAAGTSQAHTTYVFAETVPLASGKTVASVTLPGRVSAGQFHVFAIGQG
jgi:predicted alpha-1,2-mannosidase